MLASVLFSKRISAEIAKRTGLVENLRSKYGSLEELYAQAKDSQDLEKRLQEFKGVGPTTVSIFLRELRSVWEGARPRVSP